ncbi:dexamethasone-induced protein isoform X1 [Dipodomys spectabilis]|uniref:dexamethasone-induced protein isoform X1 n=1 Tax=Dipodomys spectabilis TaxID=105255 RepID=UPI001C543E59|nr:dexamethasone-induced protein isoform X1 [Dipodomys spectabilis]
MPLLLVGGTLWTRMGPQEEALQGLPASPEALCQPSSSYPEPRGGWRVGTTCQGEEGHGHPETAPCTGLVTSCWCDVYRNAASLPVLHFSPLPVSPMGADTSCCGPLDVVMDRRGELQRTP